MSSTGEIHQEPSRSLGAKNIEGLSQDFPITKEKFDPSVFKDSMVAFNNEKGLKNLSLNIPTQIDRPNILPAKEVSPSAPPTQDSNPYYSGAFMTNIFIVMQELMSLSSEMRALQDQVRRESLQSKYEGALVSAELRKDLKMNQAFQSLTSAIGSASETILGAATFARSSYVDLEATAQYDATLNQDKSAMDGAENDLKTKLGITENSAQVGGDPGVIANKKDAEERWLADPSTSPDYRDNKVEIDRLNQAYKDTKAKYDSTKRDANTIISANKNNIDSKIRLMSETLKSLTSTITQSATAGVQVSGARLEQAQAEQDATIEMINSYMQGQEQAVQQARSAVDEIKRALEQMTQSYTSSLSSRA